THERRHPTRQWGRKQRRRMSSVTLPQASAGTALFGLTVLDDASRLVLQQGTFPARYCVLCQECDTGEFVQAGREFFHSSAPGWSREVLSIGRLAESAQSDRNRVRPRPFPLPKKGAPN